MAKITPQQMLKLTANMPMKQINIDGMPYLQRHYAGTFRDGKDLWLHRFLSNDGDRHVHSHPFNFTTVMLCGGYTEEFLRPDGSQDFRTTLTDPNSDLHNLIELYLQSISREFSHGFIHSSAQFRSLDVFDWHRIAAVEDDTWTAVIVDSKRLPKWFFKDEDGQITDMKGSSRDWWKNYKTRPDCDISEDDNHA